MADCERVRKGTMLFGSFDKSGKNSIKEARMGGSGAGETEIKSRELRLVVMMLGLDSDPGVRANMR